MYSFDLKRGIVHNTIKSNRTIRMNKSAILPYYNGFKSVSFEVRKSGPVAACVTTPDQAIPLEGLGEFLLPL